jgi:hypothetical protein
MTKDSFQRTEGRRSLQAAWGDEFHIDGLLNLKVEATQSFDFDLKECFLFACQEISR